MEGTKEPTLHHFSHEHTLEHAISPSSGDPINCYGCNLRILGGKAYYTCKTCSFSLHRACSSMPRKTKHPGHPNHNLTLLVAHPSANNTFNCKACGEGITGFYYNCAKCGIYFHILCSVVPLSAVISSHPHKLKMEFAPPYDFSCDRCHRAASHKGWLYRCRFCEFDTHVACAITDQKVTPENENNELMQLLVQKYSTHEAGDGPGNSNAKNGRIGLPQMKPFMPGLLRSPTPGDQSRDISAMISDDLTLPSYQFSDFCFSIDLLKSFSGQDRPFQASKESSYQDNKSTPPPPQVEAKIKVDSVAVPNKALRASQPNKALSASQPAAHQKPADSNKPISNIVFKEPEKRLNEAFVASQNQKRKVPKGIGNKTASKHQKTKPQASSSSHSAWFKFFTCCYGSRHEKGSKNVNNHGGRRNCSL